MRLAKRAAGLILSVLICRCPVFPGTYTPDLITQRRFIMAAEPQDRVYVRVKDVAGNDFICPLDALKQTSQATDAELDNCVDDATVKRYSGNIKIKE
jgi:hypothetical protein